MLKLFLTKKPGHFFAWGDLAIAMPMLQLRGFVLNF